MNLSDFFFLLGNLAGWLLKSSRFAALNQNIKDKYIPLFILGLQIVLQFLKGAGFDIHLAGAETHLNEFPVLTSFALASFWASPLVKLFIEAFKQTAIAVLLHQLRHQSGKPE